MCFNKENTTTPSSTVPVPTQKPDITTSRDISLVDKFFDTANNVFSRVASIELERFEAERLADIRQEEAAGSVDRQQRFANGFTTQQQIVGGLSLTSILLLGTAFVLISRR